MSKIDLNVQEIESAMESVKSATTTATSTVVMADGTEVQSNCKVEMVNSKATLSYSIEMDGFRTEVTVKKSWYLKVIKAIINLLSVITDGEKAIKVTHKVVE